MRRAFWRLLGVKRHAGSRGRAIGLSIACLLLLLAASKFSRTRRAGRGGDVKEGPPIAMTHNPLSIDDASIGTAPDEARCNSAGADPVHIGINALDHLRQGRLALSAHCFLVALGACTSAGDACSRDTQRTLMVWSEHTAGVMERDPAGWGRRIVHNLDANTLSNSTARPIRMPDWSIMVWDRAIERPVCDLVVRMFEGSNHTAGAIVRGGLRVQDARFKVTEELEVRGAAREDEGWRTVELVMLGVLIKHLQIYEESNPGIVLLKSQMSDEGFRVKRYANDSAHHHAYHVDSGDEGEGNKRVLAAILYLNDVREGGETTFLNQGVSVEPRCGRLVMFPCSFTHVHAGERPVSGPKYDAVNFVTIPR